MSQGSVQMSQVSPEEQKQNLDANINMPLSSKKSLEERYQRDVPAKTKLNWEDNPSEM